MAEDPLYHMLADTIRHGIKTGLLKPGAQIPSEATLQAEFGVSHGTVRHALHLLQDEGLIRAEHGRGCFVNDPQDPKVVKVPNTKTQYGIQWPNGHVTAIVAVYGQQEAERYIAEHTSGNAVLVRREITGWEPVQ